MSEAINGSRKKEYRKPKYSILPRDIEIQRVVRAPKPLPIKCKGNVTKAVIRQRALNEQVKAHFMVDVTFNAQKGGCTDGVIKHLIATLMSTIANGSRTMGERVRKLGVDHLLSCGAPTAFAPLISLFGKLRVNPPVLRCLATSCEERSVDGQCCTVLCPPIHCPSTILCRTATACCMLLESQFGANDAL